MNYTVPYNGTFCSKKKILKSVFPPKRPWRFEIIACRIRFPPQKAPMVRLFSKFRGRVKNKS